MRLTEITDILEKWAPPTLQESYDNCGLQVGNWNSEISGALICLDVTEAVIEEAIELGLNLIIAHHPIIFSGIKKLTGNSYTERILEKAIKNNLNIFCIHTNLDNVSTGVNQRITERLGLQKLKVLQQMKNQLRKLVTFIPTNTEVDFVTKIKNALWTQGAGHIGHYDECSFSLTGKGSFKPSENTNPFIGSKGIHEEVEELRLEVIYPTHIEKNLIRALKLTHPYEEVAYDLYPLANVHQNLGAGMIGELSEPMNEADFLNYLKERMKTEVIRHTSLLGKEIKKVAVCGGSGSFLLGDAISNSADVFVTGDFKYHQFFDADGKIIICDIGHFESEQFTIDLIFDYLKENLPKFASAKTKANTNPVKYY